jgi:hypothetical protein
VKLNLWHIEDMRPNQRPEALRIGAVEAGFKRLFQLPERAAGVSLPGGNRCGNALDAEWGEAMAGADGTVGTGQALYYNKP